MWKVVKKPLVTTCVYSRVPPVKRYPVASRAWLLFVVPPSGSLQTGHIPPVDSTRWSIKCACFYLSCSGRNSDVCMKVWKLDTVPVVTISDCRRGPGLRPAPCSRSPGVCNIARRLDNRKCKTNKSTLIEPWNVEGYLFYH